MKKDTPSFDRNIPLIPAALFITSIFLSLLIYMQSIPRVADPFISHLTEDAKGEVWAIYNHYLLPLNLQDKQQKQTPVSFKEWGVERHTGFPVPLQNGGWLINRGGQNNSLWHSVLRYWRITKDIPGSTTAGSLLRCDAKFTDCRPWGDKTLNFDDSWGGLELADGRLLINDISRHKIHLVDTSGQVQHTLGGFRFPNHTETKDGKYWVVDTNRNQLKALTIGPGELSLSGEEILFSEYDGIAPQHKFPSLALAGPDNDWLLMTHNLSMAKAGLYRLSEDKKAERLGDQLPDLVTIHWHKQSVFTANFTDNQLYQIDLNTGEATMLPFWENHEAAKTQVEAEVAANFWSMLLQIAAVLTLGIASLIYAIKKGTPISEEQKASRFAFGRGHINIKAQREVSLDSEDKIVWIPRNESAISMLKKVNYMTYALLAFILLSILSLIGAMLSKDKLSIELLLLLIALLTVFIPIVYFPNKLLKAVQQRKLGKLKNCLLVNDSHQPGKIDRIPQGELCYNRDFAYAKGQLIIWQSGKYTFYDQTAFETHINPLLHQGKRISHFTLLWKNLRENGNFFDWLSIFCLAFSVIIMLWLQFQR